MLTRNHPTRSKRTTFLKYILYIKAILKRWNNIMAMRIIQNHFTRKGERGGLKIFLSDLPDRNILLNTKWIKLIQRWKTLNALCGTQLTWLTLKFGYDIHYILFLECCTYFCVLGLGYPIKMCSHYACIYKNEEVVLYVPLCVIYDCISIQ